MSVIIRLQLLPLSATAADIRSFFLGLKIPEGCVHIVGGPEGDAFIGFASDEDARLAMRKDRGFIHGQEIRLFLSSRTEMNTVISQLKAGSLSSLSSSTVAPPKIEPQGGMNAVAQAIAQPWGGNTSIYAKPVEQREEDRHSSSFSAASNAASAHVPRSLPAHDLDYGKPVYAKALPSIQQHQPVVVNGPVYTNDPFRKSAQQPMEQGEIDNDPNAYRQTNFIYRPPTEQTQQSHNEPPTQQHSQSTNNQPAMRFFNNPPSLSNSKLNMSTNSPLIGQKQQQSTTTYRQESPPPTSLNQSAEKKPPQDGPFGALPQHLRPPFGFPPSNIRQFFPGQQSSVPAGMSTIAAPPSAPRSGPSTLLQNQFDRHEQNDNEFNHRHLPTSTQPTALPSHSQSQSQQQTIAKREESWRSASAVSTAAAAAASDPTNGSHFNPPPSTFGRKPLADPLSKPLDLTPAQRPLPPPPPMLGATKGPLPPIPRNLPMPPSIAGLPPPLLTSGSGPVLGLPPPPQTPFYVELSRLPSDMLRPSVLEQFIRPSKSLALNAVKVVYGPEGIHLHTLVRLDNPADGIGMLQRDGEMGIKVRPTTKAIFEAAIDGLPTGRDDRANVDARERRREERNERRRRSRSRSQEGGRRRRGNRSRSPRRGRRGGRGSSHSPSSRRRGEDPNRWCVCLMNVPHKASEKDLREWFPSDLQPKTVRRTYYADGNASDRWIAEFEKEADVDKAFRIRYLCGGRTIKLKCISNALADEYLAIQDLYGEKKKLENDPPISHFGIHVPSSIPSSKGDGMGGRGGTVAGAGRGGARGRGQPAVSYFGNVPQMSRGQMYSSGLPPGMPHIVPPEHAMNSNRGGGGMGPRGRGRGAMHHATNMQGRDSSWRSSGGSEKEHSRPEEEEKSGHSGLDAQLLSSIGDVGTVIMCENFPPNLSLEDVMKFFEGFPVDSNSVRIRMGENNVATGDCLLCIPKPELAKEAVMKLADRYLRGHKVSVKLA